MIVFTAEQIGKMRRRKRNITDEEIAARLTRWTEVCDKGNPLDYESQTPVYQTAYRYRAILPNDYWLPTWLKNPYDQQWSVKPQKALLPAVFTTNPASTSNPASTIHIDSEESGFRSWLKRLLRLDPSS